MPATRTPTNLFLTGAPGVGKTTVIMRVLERLALKATGFYTRELRGKRGRLGFEAVTLDGERCLLAHVEIKSRYRVSKYGVDVATFEAVIVPSIDPDLHPEAALIVIDEVGKMECFSRRFCETVLKALDSPVPVLGTIAMRGRGFIESVKARPDVEVIAVTRANRDALPSLILERLGGG